jgi:hypothetical protein
MVQSDGKKKELLAQLENYGNDENSQIDEFNVPEESDGMANDSSLIRHRNRFLEEEDLMPVVKTKPS